MRVSIILVNPQLGENIGFVARVMANFNLDDLRIVSPRESWPNPKSYTTACKAGFILDKAQLFSSLEESIKDLHLVYAVSARSRHLAKEFISSREIKNIDNCKLGIMFGCESSGLSNDDLSLANKVIYINSSEKYRSMNLGHAVAIICYEINSLRSEKQNYTPNDIESYATKEEIVQMCKHLESVLEQNDYFKVKEKKITMMNNIKTMFCRRLMTSQEVRTMRGIISALDKK